MLHASEEIASVPFWLDRDFWLVTVPTLLLAHVTLKAITEDHKVITHLLSLLGLKRKPSVTEIGKHDAEHSDREYSGRHETGE